MKALTVGKFNALRTEQASTSAAPRQRSYRAPRMPLACLLAGSLLVAVPLFYLGLFGHIVADHEAHVRFIQRGIDQGVWPVHFLFPAIVYGLSGFSADFIRLASSAVAVLSVCIMAKVWLSYTLLVRRCPKLPVPTFEDAYGLSHVTFSALITGALLLSAPILRPWSTNRVYLGQISPNIWHNPTSIVCWPVVILLFFAADDLLRSRRSWGWLAVGGLAALSVLAKPNYFLAFAPVYSLLALRRFGLTRMGLLSQAALVPTVLLLCWQLSASFDGPQAMRAGWRIAWMPFSAWRIHSHSIPLSLLFSLAFPLSYVVIFRRSLQNRDLLLFAWGVLLSALVWTTCFAEVRAADGAVDFDFNFSWGSHLSIFVLFLATAMDMIDNPAAMRALSPKPAGRFASALPWWLLGTHALSGAYWIARQVIGRGFA